MFGNDVSKANYTNKEHREKLRCMVNGLTRNQSSTNPKGPLHDWWIKCLADSEKFKNPIINIQQDILNILKNTNKDRKRKASIEEINLSQTNQSKRPNLNETLTDYDHDNDAETDTRMDDNISKDMEMINMSLLNLSIKHDEKEITDKIKKTKLKKLNKEIKSKEFNKIKMEILQIIPESMKTLKKENLKISTIKLNDIEKIDDNINRLFYSNLYGK
uniref:Regulatory protein zeste n=1 Tax=Strongyloides stercoralis TaxID=6248 RepID=A0A913HVT7_STRER